MNPKSTFVRTVIILFIVFPLSTIAQLIDHPKAVLNLKINQSNGTNGSGVAYNPTTNNYFTVIAGNSDFPLEVFNSSGKNIYSTKAGSDMRGLWWNPKTKQVEGNGYGETGIIGMSLNSNGFPSVGNSTIFNGDGYQPGANSCGVYDGKKNIWYFDGSTFIPYNRKKGTQGKAITLNTGGISVANLNSTSVIYTGEKGKELGVLDYVNKKVYLVNLKSGLVTATVTLPSDAITHSMFRFAYANKQVFLYDVDSRSWTGYQIFK